MVTYPISTLKTLPFVTDLWCMVTSLNFLVFAQSELGFLVLKVAWCIAALAKGGMTLYVVCYCMSSLVQANVSRLMVSSVDDTPRALLSREDHERIVRTQVHDRQRSRHPGALRCPAKQPSQPDRSSRDRCPASMQSSARRSSACTPTSTRWVSSFHVPYSIARAFLMASL